MVVQSSADDVTAALSPEIHRNITDRLAKRLFVSAKVKILDFNRPMGTDLSFHAATDGITPGEVVTARIKKVRINMISGSVIHPDRATSRIQQPATSATIQLYSHPSSHGRVKVAVRFAMHWGEVRLLALSVHIHVADVELGADHQPIPLKVV